MFDAFYDVEEKMKKGNPYAKKARSVVAGSFDQLMFEFLSLNRVVNLDVSKHHPAIWGRFSNCQ